MGQALGAEREEECQVMAWNRSTCLCLVIYLIFIQVKIANAANLEIKSVPPVFKILSNASEALNKKEVFLNQKALTTYKTLDFPSGEYEVKTNQSSAFFVFNSNLRVKINPNSELKMILGSQDNPGMLFEIRKGLAYFKSGNSPFELFIEKLFQFKVFSGDLAVEYVVSSKKTTFYAFVADQNIQVLGDNRVTLLKPNHKIEYIPELIERELSYDFLLNDRKIPKFQVNQDIIDNSSFLKEEEWGNEKVNKANLNLKKKPELKSKTVFKSPKQICIKPAADYLDCYWVRKDKKCHRFHCNLNGQWVQETEFNEISECPIRPTVKPCEWMN